MPNEQPITVNQKDAAKLVGVSEKTLYNLRQQGKIEALPQFKSVRYSVEELKAVFGKQSGTA